MYVEFYVVLHFGSACLFSMWYSPWSRILSALCAPKVNEDEYPEYYRKNVGYIKGSNVQCPEPFRIGMYGILLKLSRTSPLTFMYVVFLPGVAIDQAYFVVCVLLTLTQGHKLFFFFFDNDNSYKHCFCCCCCYCCCCCCFALTWHVCAPLFRCDSWDLHGLRWQAHWRGRRRPVACPKVLSVSESTQACHAWHFILWHVCMSA